MSASQRPPLSARAVEVIRRIAALVPVVLRTVRRLAVASGIAVLGVAAASLALEPPRGTTEWITRAAITIAALVPAIVLLAFGAGIQGLRDLPARYRELPADVRTRLHDVRGGETEERPGRLRALIALVRTGLEAREVLSPIAILTAALRPALLVGALLAAVAAVVEIPVALLVLLVLAL